MEEISGRDANSYPSFSEIEPPLKTTTTSSVAAYLRHLSLLMKLTSIKGIPLRRSPPVGVIAALDIQVIMAAKHAL